MRACQRGKYTRIIIATIIEGGKNLGLGSVWTRVDVRDRDSSSKKCTFCNNFSSSCCPIHMTLFVQWNTKVEILKTVSMHLEWMWTIAFKFQKVCASTNVLKTNCKYSEGSHLIALSEKKIHLTHCLLSLPLQWSVNFCDSVSKNSRTGSI